jgi:hypothetical protein
MWFGVGRVPQECERCGAVVDELAGQPTLPMRPRAPFSASLALENTNYQFWKIDGRKQ